MGACGCCNSWWRHNFRNREAKDKVKIDYRPVHMKPLGDMDFVPPKPRVY